MKIKLVDFYVLYSNIMKMSIVSIVVYVGIKM